jgi:hypothetical protein
LRSQYGDADANGGYRLRFEGVVGFSRAPPGPGVLSELDGGASDFAAGTLMCDRAVMKGPIT